MNIELTHSIIIDFFKNNLLRMRHPVSLSLLQFISIFQLQYTLTILLFSFLIFVVLIIMTALSPKASLVFGKLLGISTGILYLIQSGIVCISISVTSDKTSLNPLVDQIKVHINISGKLPIATDSYERSESTTNKRLC